MAIYRLSASGGQLSLCSPSFLRSHILNVSKMQQRNNCFVNNATIVSFTFQRAGEGFMGSALTLSDVLTFSRHQAEFNIVIAESVLGNRVAEANASLHPA